MHTESDEDRVLGERSAENRRRREAHPPLELHASVQRRFDAFRDACAGVGNDPAAAMEALKDLDFDQKRAEQLISYLGEDVIMEYLAKCGPEVPENQTLYRVLLCPQIQADPHRAIATIKKLDPRVCDSVTFSELLVAAMSAKDDRILIAKIERELFDVSEWAGRSDPPSLMKGLRSAGWSYQQALDALTDLDPRRHLADYVAEFYFSPDLGYFRPDDMTSSDTEYVLSFLNEASIINKERYLDAFRKKIGRGE